MSPFVVRLNLSCAIERLLQTLTHNLAHYSIMLTKIGLPEPRTDHAVAMSRFAIVCMQKMKEIVAQLEVTLGKLRDT